MVRDVLQREGLQADVAEANRFGFGTCMAEWTDLRHPLICNLNVASENSSEPLSTSVWSQLFMMSRMEVCLSR